MLIKDYKVHCKTFSEKKVQAYLGTKVEIEAYIQHV